VLRGRYLQRKGDGEASARVQLTLGSAARRNYPRGISSACICSSAFRQTRANRTKRNVVSRILAIEFCRMNRQSERKLYSLSSLLSALYLPVLLEKALGSPSVNRPAWSL